MKNISSSLPGSPHQIGLLLLRVVMGIIFISHGVARLYHGSVPDFGNFLISEGFMIGGIIAWTVTIGEVFGGLLLITGFLLKYALVFHFIIVLSGIFLVHIQNGWFVVGHGAGGVEYSILILAVLIYMFTHSLNRNAER